MRDKKQRDHGSPITQIPYWLADLFHADKTANKQDPDPDQQPQVGVIRKYNRVNDGTFETPSRYRQESYWCEITISSTVQCSARGSFLKVGFFRFSKLSIL